jgi:hypothetical protein
MTIAFALPEWLVWLLLGWSLVCGVGVLWFGYQLYRMFWKGDRA